MTQRGGTRHWTAQDVGDQRGRVAVITGANSGLGLQTARILAEHGATVVLAGRDPGRTASAAAGIRAAQPDASVETAELDLASLADIRTAASDLAARFPTLDLLINNAGVMMPPYSLTKDGFELQFGTNHLGHFMLTGLLMPSLVLSYSHTDADIDRTIEGIGEALGVYRRALEDGVEKYLVGRPVKPVFRKFS